jgi:hypothetical protein
MAMFPCDCCGNRFVGKACYIYPALLQDDDRRGQRKRLCQTCAAQTEQLLAEHFTPFADGRVDQVYTNRNCVYGNHQRDDGNGPLAICVMYRGKDASRNWGGFVCAEHVGQAATDMLVD